MGETVVTASRAGQPLLEVPYATEAVPDELLRRRAYRTVPQALRDQPGVLVQETSPGQGSPFIRGFTGFRNLFLVDGIRLNNSVFRDGPNQYWNTVDGTALERLELLKGPGSVLYGSDAVGGTVNALTRGVDWDSERPVAGRLDYRFSDGERSQQIRAEVSARAGERTGLLLGATLGDFGNIEGGEALGTLHNTGYDQRAADVKLEHWLGDRTRLTLAHQQLEQDDVPRTHSTRFAESWEGTSVGSDRRRDLDQERRLSYLRVESTDVGPFEEVRATVSWHEQDETQVRVRSSGSTSVSAFEVDTLGLHGQATRALGEGELTFGAEAYLDEVDSSGNQSPIQGPVADDASYDTLGMYAQHRFPVGERLEWTLGARYNRAEAESDDVSDPVSGTPISIDESWDQLVGSARLLYRLDPRVWHLFGGVSQGLRAPNLSDLTRFDAARSNEFEVPSPGLDPEEFLTFELGVHGRTGRGRLEASVFYTDIRDLIVRFPTGNTNALGEFEITKGNVGDGWVYGFELGGALEVAPDWTAFGDLTFLEGRQDTYPTSAQQTEEEWLDRLMPLTLRLGLRWEHAGTWAEALSILAGEADKLSTRDRNDTQRIPPGGTPGYQVLHLAAGRRVSDHVDLRVGLDNVFDEDYRIHGSGSNMPGRNLIVGARFSF